MFKTTFYKFILFYFLENKRNFPFFAVNPAFRRRERARLPAACFFLLTMRPFLVFIRSDLPSPPDVCLAVLCQTCAFVPTAGTLPALDALRVLGAFEAFDAFDDFDDFRDFRDMRAPPALGTPIALAIFIISAIGLPEASGVFISILYIR